MTALATRDSHTGSQASTESWWSAICAIGFAPMRTNRRSTCAVDIEALLERAAAYESTQPGYAADLRAAAQRVTAPR